MKDLRYLYRTMIITGLLLSVSACGTLGPSEGQIATEVAFAVYGTGTSQALTYTPTASATPTPTTTQTPLPTEPAMPTRISPVQEGTPLPQVRAPISPQTVDYLNLLTQWKTGNTIIKVSLSPDARYLAAYSNRDLEQWRLNQDGSVWIWRIRDGRLLQKITVHPLADMDFSPDGVSLLTISIQSPTVETWRQMSWMETWRIEDGTRIATWGQNLYGLDFSPGGDQIAIITRKLTGEYQGEYGLHKFYNALVNVYEYPAMSLVREVELGSLQKHYYFSPEWLFVADSSNFYSLEDRIGHEVDGSWDMAFSPDGKMMATGHNEGFIELWSTEDGSFQGYFQDPEGAEYPISSLAFSPDGQILASISKKSNIIRLWGMSDGKLLKVLDTQSSTSRHQGVPVSFDWLILGAARNTRLAFSPDGCLLIAGVDQYVQIWGVP